MERDIQSAPRRKGRFFNPQIEKDRRTLWDFLLWRMGVYDEREALLMPPDFSYPAAPKVYDRSRPSAVWIGHSTYLIDCCGYTILTDPVWSEYCSPLPFKGLKRRQQPPFPIDALPPIDAVLISHNHYDHLDETSVRAIGRLNPRAQWFVPKGLARWFARRRIGPCVEMQWWESHQDQSGVRVTAVPAQHFSGRSLWDKDRTLWNGYVFERMHKTLYFVGDTGYNTVDFKQIGARFPSIDLSLIPIGAYLPRKFMSPVHCSPSEAVQIHLDVKSRLSLGMHWNTFHLSDEPLGRPPYDLYLAMQEKKLSFESFLPGEIGVYINW